MPTLAAPAPTGRNHRVCAARAFDSRLVECWHAGMRQKGSMVCINDRPASKAGDGHARQQHLAPAIGRRRRRRGMVCEMRDERLLRLMRHRTQLLSCISAALPTRGSERLGGRALLRENARRGPGRLPCPLCSLLLVQLWLCKSDRLLPVASGFRPRTAQAGAGAGQHGLFRNAHLDLRLREALLHQKSAHVFHVSPATAGARSAGTGRAGASDAGSYFLRSSSDAFWVFGCVRNCTALCTCSSLGAASSSPSPSGAAGALMGSVMPRRGRRRGRANAAGAARQAAAGGPCTPAPVASRPSLGSNTCAHKLPHARRCSTHPGELRTQRQTPIRRALGARARARVPSLLGACEEAAPLVLPSCRPAPPRASLHTLAVGPMTQLRVDLRMLSRHF